MRLPIERICPLLRETKQKTDDTKQALALPTCTSQTRCKARRRICRERSVRLRNDLQTFGARAFDYRRIVAAVSTSTLACCAARRGDRARRVLGDEHVAAARQTFSRPTFAVERASACRRTRNLQVGRCRFLLLLLSYCCSFVNIRERERQKKSLFFWFFFLLARRSQFSLTCAQFGGGSRPRSSLQTPNSHLYLSGHSISPRIGGQRSALARRPPPVLLRT